MALASGRVWQGVPEADRELITRLTREELDKQMLPDKRHLMMTVIREQRGKENQSTTKA